MRHLITICAAALLLTACATPNVNTGTVTPGSGQAAPAQAPAAEKKPPTWGERYTWPNGLAIEIAKPVACKPGQYAIPKVPARAVKVTFKITNGTDKPFDPGMLSFGSDVQFAGASAEKVYDSSGSCDAGVGLETATVLPGKTYSYEVAYAVGAEPGELQIALQPAFGEDKAVFVGPA